MSKLLRRTATNSRALLAVLAIVFGVNESSAAQGISPDQYDALYYRHIGPVGNRIASVAGIPGDPMTYYVGAASGGIWKTVDGGVFWAPIFDGYPVQAIGALSVSVLDSEIVWAGTGESHIRSNVTIGDGVWKSTDGGATWHHMGLDAAGRISRIVIHPTNPDVVYVASLGHGKPHEFLDPTSPRQPHVSACVADGRTVDYSPIFYEALDGLDRCDAHVSCSDLHRCRRSPIGGPPGGCAERRANRVL